MSSQGNLSYFMIPTSKAMLLLEWGHTTIQAEKDLTRSLGQNLVQSRVRHEVRPSCSGLYKAGFWKSTWQTIFSLENLIPCLTHPLLVCLYKLLPASSLTPRFSVWLCLPSSHHVFLWKAWAHRLSTLPASVSRLLFFALLSKLCSNPSWLRQPPAQSLCSRPDHRGRSPLNSQEFIKLQGVKPEHSIQMWSNGYWVEGIITTY